MKHSILVRITVDVESDDEYAPEIILSDILNAKNEDEARCYADFEIIEEPKP